MFRFLCANELGTSAIASSFPCPLISLPQTGGFSHLKICRHLNLPVSSPLRNLCFLVMFAAFFLAFEATNTGFNQKLGFFLAASVATRLKTPITSLACSVTTSSRRSLFRNFFLRVEPLIFSLIFYFEATKSKIHTSFYGGADFNSADKKSIQLYFFLNTITVRCARCVPAKQLSIPLKNEDFEFEA